jgi:ribosome-associated protein
MTEQTEAAFNDSQDEFDDDIDWVSKSQLKRDSKALQDLGKRLCALNSEQLSRIPLNEQLQQAIELAHRISNKRGALKRHFQFIGKLLRNIDAEPIIDAVQAIDNTHAHDVAKFRNLEQWRDRILEHGDTAIHEFCNETPGADRQQLRQILRNHNNAKDDSGKTRFARLLFKAIRDTQ